MVQQRDHFKRVVCDHTGITLIVIPYWWDRTVESVAGTIHAVRPDMCINTTFLNGSMVSSLMPKHHDQPCEMI